MSGTNVKYPTIIGKLIKDVENLKKKFINNDNNVDYSEQINIIENSIASLTEQLESHNKTINDSINNINGSINDINTAVSAVQLKAIHNETNISSTTLALSAVIQTINDLSLENGSMSEKDCERLYGNDPNYKMSCSYQCIGDYCTITVKDLKISQGWQHIYYRLPKPVAANSTFIARTNGDDPQEVCITLQEYEDASNNLYGLNVIHIHHKDLKNNDQGYGLSESIISFTTTYKYK